VSNTDVYNIEMSKDRYGLKMLLLIGVLFSIMALMFNKIQQSDPQPIITPNYTMPVVTNKPIYILKSYATAVTYQKNNLDKNNYIDKVEQFNKYIKKLGYKTISVDEDKVGTLPNDALLFIPDAIALSLHAKTDIKSFLNNGGNLFFNNSCGFSDEKGSYIGDNFVKEITSLGLSKNKNFATFKDGVVFTQRLLSPIDNKYKGEILETSIYDPVPIFISSQDKEADILLTTYSLANPPLAKDGRDDFTTEESGVAWHGYYGKGKWFYMNIPSYVFYDVAEKDNPYNSVMNSILNFLSSDVIIETLPFIDKEKIVFISEDTEYKFKNFKKFADLAQAHHVPVTAFIVSSLAQKKEHQTMMREIARNPYVEFASHSHNHKKIIETNATYVTQETAGSKTIIDRYSSQPIVGFRPPREELDLEMKKQLRGSGFRYILSKTQRYMYPKFDEKYRDLLIIPRHGTDDYSYLINLDWDQNQIVNQIKKETNFVTALDAIFTLSIHTHLFAYNSNINIVKEYFKYLNENPQFQPLNGREIAKRVIEHANIDINYKKSGNLITLEIDNRNTNPVENFSCKLFKNPNIKTKSIRCDETPGSKNTKNPEATVIQLKHLKPSSKTIVYIEVQ